MRLKNEIQRSMMFIMIATLITVYATTTFLIYRQTTKVVEDELGQEAEYMKTLAKAYNNAEKADFYNFVRSLDALKASLKGNNKTIILDKDSELAKILYSGN